MSNMGEILKKKIYKIYTIMSIEYNFLFLHTILLGEKTIIYCLTN